MDREDFAERKRLGAEYLARIARASAEHRKELLVEWAEKLYDAHAVRRVGLLTSSDDIHRLLFDLDLYYSGTMISELADAHPDDFESEAISLAIAGRKSYWFARSAVFSPAATADAEEDLAKKSLVTPLGRNLDRLRRESGWTFDEMAMATAIGKKLILGHVNKGKNANPGTVAAYAIAFTERLGRPVTVAELIS